MLNGNRTIVFKKEVTRRNSYVLFDVPSELLADCS